MLYNIHLKYETYKACKCNIKNPCSLFCYEVKYKMIFDNLKTNFYDVPICDLSLVV